MPQFVSDIGNGFVLGLCEGLLEAPLIEGGVPVVELLEGFEFTGVESGETAFLPHEPGKGFDEFRERPGALREGLAVIDAAGLLGQLLFVFVDQQVQVVVLGLARDTVHTGSFTIFPVVKRALAEVDSL